MVTGSIRDVILACFLLAATPQPLFAQAQTDAEPARLSLADLIEQAEPACVRLDVVFPGAKGIGSGFLVRKPDWVVTNFHVVAGAEKATATFADGTTAEVEGFLAYAVRRDVIVLKIKTDRKLSPLRLAEKLPRKGESVVAIGAPQGLSFTATEGIISAIRDGTELKEFGKDATGTWLQTSTPISPGSSGGPLLNLQGEVVGANSGSLESAQNLNFAIGAEDIVYALDAAEKSPLRGLAKIEHQPDARPTPMSESTPGATTPQPASGDRIVCKLPAERRFNHRFTIAKEEDEFDKLTWLRTEWMPLKHADPRLVTCGLRISIPYRENSPSPAAIWELGTTARSFAFIAPGARHFQLLLDGKSVDLGDLRHKGEVGRGGVSETLTVYLRLDGFLEIIMSGEVKARIGSLEFELSRDQLECLRDLACRLPTGETPEAAMQVERYQLHEDPTAPPSMASKSRPKVKTESPGEDTSKPAAESDPKHAFRTWTSLDGKFTVEAKFVKFIAGVVYLQRKDNGQEIRVPLDKLSTPDQEFVATLAK